MIDIKHEYNRTLRRHRQLKRFARLGMAAASALILLWLAAWLTRLGLAHALIALGIWSVLAWGAWGLW